MPNRAYTYYDLTASICSVCYEKVEAKIIFEEERVYLVKRCLKHGPEKVLISTDKDYYLKCRHYIKPSEMPHRFNTPIRYGCPYDCGLCPDHEQHSCLTLIEVTDRCNLECPICYANSSPHREQFRSLQVIESMLDAVVANEKEPDVVQISGGEPTIHPEFFAILDAAKARPIRHLMINTNGIKIAQDREFVRKLAAYMPGIEIYLQFDSLEPHVLKELRGADLSMIREKALYHLNEFGLSTTLVVTVKRGLNDDQLGSILNYAIQQPAVRGVTFQPIQEAGRLDQYDPGEHRLTLSEVRTKILEQSDLFDSDDLIPVPCHPDALAMAYALKLGEEVLPLTGLLPPDMLLEGGRNTIVFEQDAELRAKMNQLFSLSQTPESTPSSLRELLCCLPKVEAPASLSYENVFRVLIMQFMDARDLDIRSVKRSCVHIAHPDGRIIPFDTYNLFYRDGLEERLTPIRSKIEGE
ncbi:radical SAM protein [Marinicrinis sediminis]|uniref:Radical SAM protein n=1 Tax=Marinicrinis sediminis TaxID=1652465 RepID=A0ABW5REM3_9BACL